MRQAGLEDLPQFVEPMLPISASATGDWATEVKWDGIRAQLRFDGSHDALRRDDSGTPRTNRLSSDSNSPCLLRPGK